MHFPVTGSLLAFCDVFLEGGFVVPLVRPLSSFIEASSSVVSNMFGSALGGTLLSDFLPPPNIEGKGWLKERACLRGPESVVSG